MASERQVQAAKRNVKKAQRAAGRKRTIANLPASTRRGLGKQAAKGRQRGGEAGHALEDRNRGQLYEIAKEQNIHDRSQMGEMGFNSGDPQLPQTNRQKRPSGPNEAKVGS